MTQVSRHAREPGLHLQVLLWRSAYQLLRRKKAGPTIVHVRRPSDERVVADVQRYCFVGKRFFADHRCCYDDVGRTSGIGEDQDQMRYILVPNGEEERAPRASQLHAGYARSASSAASSSSEDSIEEASSSVRPCPVSRSRRSISLDDSPGLCHSGKVCVRSRRSYLS